MLSRGKRQSLVIRLIFLLTLVFAIQHQSKQLKAIVFVNEDEELPSPDIHIQAKTHGPIKHPKVKDLDGPSELSNNVNIANAEQTEVATSVQVTTANTDHSSSTKPCALLFFGLIKEFSNLALPAIQRHILQPNPTCDIFLHTYNITVTRISRRNMESKPYQVRVEEAFQLTDHVVLDTDRSFEDAHSKFLRKTRRLYHREWGACCKSHDNMIKQWHSIKRVWDLMVEHEQKKLMEGQTKNEFYYEQIGLFRSDVFYMSPINLFDSNNATVPNFASYTGYNDRLFIGQRQYAQVWADRFSFAPTFEKKYMVSSITKGKKRGYHSESFLFHLLNHNHVPVEKKNICVWRIRAGSRLAVEDCTKDANWFTKEDIPKYLPEGYTLQVVEDFVKLRNGKNRTSRSLWGFPPGSNATT